MTGDQQRLLLLPNITLPSNPPGQSDGLRILATPVAFLRQMQQHIRDTAIGREQFGKVQRRLVALPAPLLPLRHRAALCLLESQQYGGISRVGAFAKLRIFFHHSFVFRQRLAVVPRLLQDLGVEIVELCRILLMRIVFQIVTVPVGRL